MLSEKSLRKQIRKQLLKLVIESQQTALNEEKADEDFDPAELEGMPVPEYLKKMLDPDVSKEMYAKLDQKVDAGGNPAHQAFALAAFALSYAEMDGAGAESLLTRARKLAIKIAQIRAKNAEKGKDATEDTAEEAAAADDEEIRA